MKKLLCMLLSLIMVLSLVACSASDIEDNEEKSDSVKDGYVSSEHVAVVMVNGEETARYVLNKDTEVVIKNGDNYNVLTIKDGVAFISEASCPEKLCMEQGAILYNSETITCLPNKVVIKVISDVEPEEDFHS